MITPDDKQRKTYDPAYYPSFSPLSAQVISEKHTWGFCKEHGWISLNTLMSKKLIAATKENLCPVCESNFAKRTCINPFEIEGVIQALHACNISGVAIHFAEIASQISNEATILGLGTDWKNKHPICAMFAHKLADLAGMGRSYDMFHVNYDLIKEANKIRLKGE